VPIEVSLPKYATIVNAVQERIEGGTYPPGSLLPSESDLMKEFRVSRPTVVRALEFLRQQGWIEGHQGKGRYVLGRPARASRRSPEQAYALLNADETAGVKILEVGPVLAPARAASALELDPGTPVVARRRLVVAEEVGPVELGTAYVPVELAAGTDVGASNPLPEGLLRHLERAKNVEFDHASERISARLPSADEATLLEIGRRDPVLTVLLAVCDRAGKPLVAVDVVLPASRHELEDVFPLA
jgi:DNA-binding GntR family transcriptional regulator